MSFYEGVSDEPEDGDFPEEDQDESSLLALPRVPVSPRRSQRAVSPAGLKIQLVTRFKVGIDDETVQVEDERTVASDVEIDAEPYSGPEDAVFSPPKGSGKGVKRRRKILSASGEWIDEGELAGRTITHEAPRAPIRRSDRKQGKRPPPGESWDHNPFRLVPPTPYGDAAPFQVIVAPQVLLTMDFHAHMSVAEVIGLLGGRFDADTRRLHVLSIFPCRSVGTRKECEMDPLSEMEAVQQFAALDLQPVGWYHSHPTFEPSPSCRDIETQTMYQSLFSRPADNAEPFLGFIVSPFMKSSKGKTSLIECVHLANDIAHDEAFRLPCRVDYLIDDTGEFFEYPGDLVDLYEKLQLTYMRSLNYAGTFYENYFINKLASRLTDCAYEPSARALLQRFRNKLREHL